MGTSTTPIDRETATMQLLSNTVVLLLIPTMLAFPLYSEGSEGQLVPDLGISSINDVNIENVGTILDLMIKSGGSVKNVIDKFSNLSNLEIVEELVNESEEIITRLQQGVSEINEKHRSFAGQALKDMIYIKLQLKTSRISLNDLAQRTVFAVANMRANLETLKKDGELAISDVQELMATQDEVEEYLYNEEQTLVFWATALQLVERKVENTDRLFLKAPKIVKQRYLNSLDELQKAAQNYLDQEEL